MRHTVDGVNVCTHATRGVYCGGESVQGAAQEARKRVLEFASWLVKVNSEALQIRPDETAGQGIIFLEGAKGKSISVGEVAKTAQFKGWGIAITVVSHRQVNCPPAL